MLGVTIHHLHGTVAEPDRADRPDHFLRRLGSGFVCAARGRIVREAEDGLPNSATPFINPLAAQRFAIELRKVGLAGNSEVNFDVPNTSLSRRNKLDRVAVGIGQFERHRGGGTANGASSFPATPASLRQRTTGMVYLEDGTEQAIAMLMHSAAQGEKFFVGQP